MGRLFDFEPELALFLTSEEAAETDAGRASGDLRAELRRRLEAWRARLPKPSREQLVTATDNRDHVLFHDDTPHLWERLEREWRGRQTPDFQPFQGETWPSEAREWLEKERRAGRIYQEQGEAESHYRYSRPFEVAQRKSHVIFTTALESTPEKSQPASTAADHEPTDAELLEFMRPSARHEFEKPEASPKDRARIWQGTKKRWMAVHRPAKKIANEDIVRDTGDTDRQVRESLERRYMPLSFVQPSPFTQPSTVWIIWSFLRKFVALGGLALLGACLDDDPNRRIRSCHRPAFSRDDGFCLTGL